MTPLVHKLRPLVAVGHALVVGAASLAVLAAALPFLRATSRPAPAPPPPPSMEQVDWHDPQGSGYCLACHRLVAPAMGLRDVQQGHPQNVPLNDVQLQAVAELGTVVGPGNTLICMSCHKLDAPPDTPHMLADTLEDSRLCQRCHPGHYARFTPHDLRHSAPTERNRLGQTAAAGGPCSACHLAHRDARQFVHTALDPDGRCVTCHQVYRVAEGHARTRMDHPEAHCVACHNPHDMSHGAFLHASATELCLRCHADMGRGPAHGMHPLGPMEYDVPPSLVTADAQVGTSPRELTCLTCHAAHATNYPALLRMERDSNRLCLTCHEEKLAERTHARILPRHGQSHVLSAGQLAVVQNWGTRVGAEGQLLCTSCHRVHGGGSEPALLAFTPRYGETCLQCHPRETTVLGSVHDLRTNFPQEQNIVGATPGAAGACSACHLAHGFARPFAPAPGDPAGQCASCHQPGACAAAKPAADRAHPQTRCPDCHNPHRPEFGAFLKHEERALCSACHADAYRLVGGPHDAEMTRNSARWDALGVARHRLCLGCHVAHGGAQPALFRIAPPRPAEHRDDLCLACHPDAAWQANSDIAAIHPCSTTTQDPDGLPAMSGCGTCHDAHQGAPPAHLIRVARDEPTQQLCLRCHRDKELIRFTGHAAERLEAHDFDIDSCKPCHAMHARPDGTWGQMLSPRFLMHRCAGVLGAGVSCVPCLACHHAQGPAPIREVATHPEVIMQNISEPGTPGYLPLYDPGGHEDPGGQVTCRTCHVSHGRLDLLQRMANTPSLTPEEQDALRAQVRPFIAPNVCTACHGAAARNRFLHFHDRRWRESAKEK